MVHKTHRQRIVIIGGGFGGLYAAKELAKANAHITLIDRRNFHLFQPLLYQVATGGLSPGDIASPLRAILAKRKNVRVMKAEAIDINPDKRLVVTSEGMVEYDRLIVAAGSSHHYFGNDHWAAHAPGLKTIEDAVEIRRRIFDAFEKAETESDDEMRRALMRFVIVGGGPTGVELAGAVAELAHETLRNDFRTIDPADAEIYLVEAADDILGTYPEKLQRKARESLKRLGVMVKTGHFVTGIEDATVSLEYEGESFMLAAGTVLWAAGVKASSLGRIIAEKTGAAIDKSGRVKVEMDLSVTGYPEIVVIGDMADCNDEQGEPLPGVAPVAMQQGEYTARRLKHEIQNRAYEKPFRYINRGSMAVIGRNSAVAYRGNHKVSGFWAWLVWLFVHIAFLIEYDNKLIVLIQWAGDYFTRKRGARLITFGSNHQAAERHSGKGVMMPDRMER